MVKLGIIACAICAAAGATIAAAPDISTRTKEAAALAEQGKFVEAFGALNEAEVAIWDRMPLTIQRALWVADSPTGFGVYTPRSNTISLTPARRCRSMPSRWALAGASRVISGTSN